ncbi:polyketide synthase [Amycolatopsis albispora]|uniref:6-deoxyerythronolide-B synthase n=1 Tax=Amycolatopsis albispora TaxID=1804986 RepID=A0A344L338_9PSEU|nr:type I polyketide synthase [Amycolatopsis albispora]AXB42462.1 polyketide synthase [Amycolatopsis albispora]
MTNEDKLVEYLRRVTGDLQATRERVRELEDRDREPIAIVGMACRFPGGVDSPEALWRLVENGTDAVSEFPGNRGWALDELFGDDPDQPGTSTTREGGFLHNAGEFDAAFFGISPREALTIDPQQRLLLETSWEAFERAGIDPHTARGSRTGVFAGVMYNDYGSRLLNRPGGAAEFEGYLGNGSAGSIASGRLAYTLGLVGPAVTVDTACSSSLVALHLAAQSLRSGECSLALAGGVAVMSTPSTFVEFSRQRGLAADGRCKPFAAAADGTGWSEGVGMLLVERLSDARRNGHRVLAVLRGSAVNQDGASSGLTAPNGPSQERVIRAALSNAGLSTVDVDAVEAHGTGTTLGDPIEAQALLATYGQGRERPLALGSVKSNLGHTQAAAGVAGVIKMALAMQHGVLPKTLHVDEPTPHVDWASGAVSVLTEPMPWPEADRPRRAGVSGFGVSGTNAHVILEQAPPEETPAATPVPAMIPWVLSGKGEGAVREQAVRLLSHLDSDANPADIGFSLAATRSTHEHRAVVLGADRDELVAGLHELAAGKPGPVTGRATAAPKVVFVFPGQGAQWAGMAVELLELPVFVESMAACAEALSPFVEWSLLDAVADEGLLERVDVVQPVLWAVMVSLAELWRSFGVEPAAVVGHSQGEIAAACVAGALSLEDAAKVVALRSKALPALSGRGGMVSIPLPEAEVRQRIDDRISVAAVNGPASVVVSGEPDALDELLGSCAADGIRAKRIPVDYASHSPQVEAIEDGLRADLAGIKPQRSRVPFCSAVTGAVLDTSELDAAYWYRNLREPVRFDRAVTALLDQGREIFAEISPHPVLAASIQEAFDQRDLADAVVAGTLRRHDGGPRRFLTSLAEVHVRGAAVNWAAAFPGARPVELPTYAFQRQHYWLDAGPATAGDLGSAGLRSPDHPLLGAMVALADGDGCLLTGRLSLTSHPWLAEHAVRDTAIVPGTALLEMVIRAADQVGCGRVGELVLQAPLPVADPVQVQVVVGAADETGRRPVELHSRREDEPWTCHATGTVSPGATTPASPGEWPPPNAEAVDLEGFYDGLAERGLRYGPVFQGVQAVWRRGEEIFAEVALRPETTDAAAYGVHPALLDAALHALVVTDDNTEPRLPFSWNGVTLHASGADKLRVRLTPSAPGVLALTATDATGRPVTTVDSLTLRPLTPEALSTGAESLYRVEWAPMPVVPAAAAPDAEVVWLPRAGGDLIEATHEAASEALGLVQSWLTEDRPGSLVLVTRCAVAIGDEEPDVARAAVWGLVRSAQAENPDRFVLVDADENTTEAAVLAAVASGEPQLAIRGDRVHVPRLARTTGSGGVAFDPDGTVLLSGATGTLGRLITRHLVREHGVRHLVLAGRRGSAPELEAELTALGANVTMAACDMADRAAVADLIDAIPATHPLTGVLHLAGVLDDGVVGALTPERLSAVLRPKADAAIHLHELTADRPLSAFIVFSSAGATFGAPGQANYAAANAALDALAAHRRARGLPGLSLAWGLWAERGGMTGHLDDGELRRITGSGVEPLPADEGLALFDAACAHPEAALVPVRLNASALRAQAKAGTLPAIFRGLFRGPARPSAGNTPATSSLRTELAAAPESRREQLLLDLVRTEAAAVLGHAARDAVEEKARFAELGFDSLTAVQLRNRLNGATGLRLPATMVFDHPTPRALARFLRGELLGLESVTTTAPASGATDEPVAIVGMACRFPGGVDSPEALWELLTDGRDGFSEFPADRGWNLDELFDNDPERTGRSYVREGGFLHDAAEFDAGFFGISPREALSMDPQQRLLLETSWEAIERAGIDPLSLQGSQTGVFAGVMYNDYGARLLMRPDGPAEFEGYLGNGSAASVASGRVAYALGLEGPALTVDTACSSSLVALHLAAQALRHGECSLAVAGGVSVMSTPGTFVEFSRQRGLAPDGRCKSFGAGADGTAMSEGVAMLVVERLSDARRNGHPVLAVVRGSAVNSDGASNGLTAPNGPSQERVIRAALANAGLSTVDVDAVEAHGTGTTLGDPIEAQALLATYGQGREQPLRLGSVKSNLGHTQAAAGVAGVVKMVLAMRHGVLPKTLHVDEPTPHVDWSSGAVSLLTEAEPWPETERPCRSAVSSFGISGTNAHLVLEQAPAEPERVPVVSEGPVFWPISGANEAALRAQAERLAVHLADRPGLSPADVGYSLATTRSHLSHRAVVLGSDVDDLLRGLRALAAGTPAPNVVSATTAGERPVFVFPGQGAQWAGMAVELLGVSSVFAGSMGACAEALSPFVEWSLLDVLADGGLLGRVDVVQPVLWAVMVSLAEVWRSFGVEPAAVVGHSQGEIAAACVAGVLSLEDGAKVVALRSKALLKLSGGGGMVSVALPEAEVRARIDDRISVAAVNGPASVVVSGPADALDELIAEFAAEEISARRIPVDYASHSPAVTAIEDELLTVLGEIPSQAPAVPFLSTVTGEPVGELDARYWYRNLRETVRFDEVVRKLAEQGHGVFLEVSPHPVLVPSLQETAEAAIGTLRRDQGGLDRFLRSLAEAHVHGAEPRWDRIFPGAGRVDLPTYAFQRQRFWLDAPATPAATAAADDEFWSAVERGDLDELTGALRVNGADPRDALSELLPFLADWRRNRQVQSTVDSWRYRVRWRPVRAEPPEPGRRIAVVPSGFADDPWVSACVRGLANHGELTTVEHDGRFAERFREALADGPVSAVVSLLAADEHTGFANTLGLVQLLGELGAPAPIWAVTRSAVSAGHRDPVRNPRQALVWGFGRVVGLEHPDRWGGLIDLPDVLDERSIELALGAPAPEDQVAVRGGRLLARRLVRAPLDQGAARRDWRPAGTSLITGGTGALGAQVARWLARSGAEHLLLVSRRGPAAPGAGELEAELTGLGAKVTIASCDVSDREALADLLGSIPAEQPLTGIFHTAAVLDDAMVDALTPGQLGHALSVKADAAVHLHELTKDADLSAFVLFSSTAGTFGAAGQGNYAPGNAFLDAFAHWRRAQGLPATSVAWGAWADGGMAELSSVGEVLRRHGVPAMAPDLATTALRQALETGETALVVADIEWERFAVAFTATRPAPALDEIPEVRELAEATAERGTEQTAPLVERLASASAAERDRLLLEAVRENVAAVLGYATPGELAVTRPFTELGFDSVTAVEIRNRLNRVTGLRLPATLVFNHQTPAALARFLRTELAPAASPVPAELDRLEAALGDGSDVDPAVVTRLRALLHRCEGPPPEDDEFLESASEEDIFAIIDQELGRS